MLLILEVNRKRRCDHFGRFLCQFLDDIPLDIKVVDHEFSVQNIVEVVGFLEH